MIAFISLFQILAWLSAGIMHVCEDEKAYRELWGECVFACVCACGFDGKFVMAGLLWLNISEPEHQW